MDPKIERLKQRFFQVFGDQGRHVAVVKAPGRVNLIGEHTDYNEGFCLPTNFPLEVTVIAQRRNDGMLGMYSADFEERIQVPVGNLRYLPGDGWANYPKSVLWSFQASGQKFEGMNLLISGNIPQGSGLSSSAALEAAIGLAVAALEGIQTDPKTLAKVLQRGENQFIGVHSGIMDQLCVLSAEKGNAIFLDCRSLETEQVPVAFDGALFVVVDSGVSRSLKSGEYNKRREECKEALRLLKTKNEAYQALRDVKVIAFERHKKVLSPLLAKRAEHVVYENDRVLKAVEAMKAADAATFGDLMNKSHRSLSALYNVSTEELDALFQMASSDPGCYGARMTGGGFGGCLLALVKEEGIDTFLEKLTRTYWQRVGGKAKTYVLDIVEKAHEVVEEGAEA